MDQNVLGEPYPKLVAMASSGRPHALFTHAPNSAERPSVPRLHRTRRGKNPHTKESPAIFFCFPTNQGHSFQFSGKEQSKATLQAPLGHLPRLAGPAAGAKILMKGNRFAISEPYLATR